MYKSFRFHTAFRGGRSHVHTTLERFSRNCNELSLPFAVAGGLAVNANGDPDRVTRNVDVIMAKPDLEKFKSRYIGHGYVNKFPGSDGMRDELTNVPIEVFLSGGVPGSGNPEDTPVRFPFPDKEEENLIDFGDAIPYLGLVPLIELKLASGMTDPVRMKDFVDVQELIKYNDIPVEFDENLDPSVREKFREIWGYAQKQKEHEAQ